ncbi:MAG: hypothetical protein E7329_01105 [Clostridiales bacterium]|nr:hypothetical protein [Clostridiales bacterium]
MKRYNGVLALVLCLLLAMSAQAEIKEGSNASRLLVVEEGVEVFLSKVKEWTMVTPETMEENMALLTALGDSEEAVRYRFANGNIVFEAYHKGLPDGRVRLQIFEDEFTRSVWHLDDLTKKQYIAVAEELEDGMFQGYIQMLNLDYNASTAKGRVIKGALIAYPPFAYESGRFSLSFFNGKAYLASYTQTTEATLKKHLKQDNTYARMQDWTPVEASMKLTGERLPSVADLRTDYSRLILNAHSGPFTFTGISEKDAQVTLKNSDQEWKAAVDKEGNYSAEIMLAAGENEIMAVANKAKLGENTLSRIISVDDAMAALELNEYPYDFVIRDEIRLAGKASSGAKVTVKVDGGEPASVSVEADGSFAYELEAEDWVEHTVEITASEDGKEDCTAKFSFTPEYEDAAKGIKAYGKTLTEGVSGKAISNDPSAHVGSRVKLEVYTKEVERTDGRLILKGNINKDEDMPVILVCDSYLEDMILQKMILTVYGEVIEPSLTETPIPRIHVEYIQYLKLVYKR